MSLDGSLALSSFERVSLVLSRAFNWFYICISICVNCASAEKPTKQNLYITINRNFWRCEHKCDFLFIGWRPIFIECDCELSTVEKAISTVNVMTYCVARSWLETVITTSWHIMFISFTLNGTWNVSRKRIIFINIVLTIQQQPGTIYPRLCCT